MASRIALWAASQPFTSSAGIGLGVAERLGFGERGLEGEAGVGHAAEDVVRGAVDDAGKREDAIADERVLHRADDRDATGHRGLEVDRRVGFPGNARTSSTPRSASSALLPVTTGFFARKRGGDDLESIRRAADQLDDDVHGRILDQRMPIRGEDPGGHFAGGGTGLGRDRGRGFWRCAGAHRHRCVR